MVARNVLSQLPTHGLAIAAYGLGSLLEDTSWDAQLESPLHVDLHSPLHTQVLAQVKRLPRVLPEAVRPTREEAGSAKRGPVHVSYGVETWHNTRDLGEGELLSYTPGPGGPSAQEGGRGGMA